MSNEPLGAVPGNVRVIEQERDRLLRLAELHERGRKLLHTLHVASWTGPAATGFDEVLRTQTRSWSRAADYYTEAAVALSRHIEEFGELQKLANSVISDARQSRDAVRIEAARQSLQRWQHQAHESAGRVARTLRQLAGQLRALGQEWPDWAPEPVPEPEFVVQAPSSTSPSTDTTSQAERQREPDPPRRAIAPMDYRSPDHLRDKIELSNAVFRSWHGELTP